MPKPAKSARFNLFLVNLLLTFEGWVTSLGAGRKLDHTVAVLVVVF
ncbi:hypothetical protein CEPID_02920 [Corynebacterium epidermidicanis]|uniref:Uncharacterized protein n=1 Tax=Corynebacterium epidermidicanis TaxID=1050174 RepID=A0A0G3GMU7_9CORY|nr:hypothetical protein CEPID_02920 [Corynebacterium epidermidicanis]